LRDRGERMKYMGCEEFFDDVIDYVEGELPPERRAELEEHLAGCPSCREAVLSVRAILNDAAGDLEDPGDAYFESLSARVMEEVRGKGADSPRRGVFARLAGLGWRPAVALSATIVAAVLAVSLAARDVPWEPPSSAEEVEIIVREARRFALVSQLQLTRLELPSDDAVEESSDQSDVESDDVLAAGIFQRLDDDEEVFEAVGRELEFTARPGFLGDYADLTEEEGGELREHLLEAMNSWSI